MRRSAEIGMVKCVEEVGSELQSHPLCEEKILLQADIEVLIRRPNDGSLCRTIPETGRRLGEGTAVEPLHSRRCDRLRVVDGPIAVWTRGGRSCSRSIRCVKS